MKIKYLFGAALLLLSASDMMAQQMQLPPIPVDKNVRVGKLSNGLTYYIRHNEFPKNVANFYIAQRVGSINENDNQRGLAHFLEHMAFNGSEHFKGNGIIEYTRTLGVAFGRNLNAYTSVDQTVYNICDVPTTRQTALDSCLLILKDWSNGLILEDKEINKERGVIHQEWQRSASAGMRFYEKYLPMLYPNSKYGHRLPIGLMDIIDNFKPKELRDYYKKWYRPDNQAIIVVGNVDVDHIEAEIKKLWSGVVVPANAAKVVDEKVPDTDQPIYVSYKDKEQQYTIIQMMMKHDVTPASEKTSVAYWVENYIKSMISNMLNARFMELGQNPDCPYVQAFAGDGTYLLSKTKDAFQSAVVPKEGKDIEAFDVLVREIHRARQFGFTETEYARAKSDYLSALEKKFTNKDKTENVYFYNQYVNHYLSNEPMPSIEDEYQMLNAIVPNIPVQAINEMAKQLISDKDSNLVVTEQEQEKEGKVYTPIENLRSTLESVRAEKLMPWVDNVKNEPLIAKLPTKGKIVKEKENKKLGYKKLTLSNGAKVILKKTDFKDDEILMQAYAKGGKNLFGEKDFANLKVFDYVVESQGLGNFSNTELTKALAGKQISANISVGLTHTNVSGSSTPKDLESMMQLVYLCFTKIGKDEKSYKSLISQLEIGLKNKDLQPESVFSDSLAISRYNHNPRFAPLDIKDLDKVNLDRILEMAGQLTGDAGQYTFIFTGNFDEAAIRPLLEQYIATIPGDPKARVEPGKDVIDLTTGELKNHFTRKMETPKAMLYTFWRSNLQDDNLENEVLADAAGQVLSMKFLRTIREDASAAYSVGASGFAQPNVNNDVYYIVYAGCPMDPAKAQQAYDLMMKGMTEAGEKVSAEDVQKVKEFMLKQADVNARKNGHWLNVINNVEEWGIDFQTDYKKTVEAITPEKISKFLKDIVLASGNKVEVMMEPEK